MNIDAEILKYTHYKPNPPICKQGMMGPIEFNSCC